MDGRLFPVDRSQIKGRHWVFALVLSSLPFGVGELGWRAWCSAASYSYSLYRFGRRPMRLGKNHGQPTYFFNYVVFVQLYAR
ncbi:hypothetical protein BDV41DRAFT_395488 [Aspergillus transmontanensis]|uniref:Uncharacterized protein n=1 Tax=Aspergillus transmontanensis TaxID=1034304 RepID=A0A5N6VP77_9EURO|nr:hypothetical protein BDV41DRAFT_395488 [Aspergillus transmontanensis]